MDERLLNPCHCGILGYKCLCPPRQLEPETQPTVDVEPPEWGERYILSKEYPPSSFTVPAESVVTFSNQKEAVDHPEHYNPGVYEVINIIEHYKLGFHLGNTLKYMLRAGKKHDNIKEDIDKAIWYLQRYKEKL